MKKYLVAIFTTLFVLTGCSSDSDVVKNDSSLQSISAVYEGSTEEGTTISKNDFVVTGTYEDGSSQTIKKYDMDSVTLENGVTSSIEISVGDVSTSVDIIGTPTVSQEFKNALKTADSYAKTMHLSKQRIFDQLTSQYGNQFPEDAAQYAIDNVHADWNENALAQAKSYSDTMHMSRQGIYDQLTSEYGEQFTAEEAQYAIDNLDVDYNENALAKAKTYYEDMAMSKEAVYDQLTSEYGEQFTAEEAQYAIDNLN